MMNLLEMVVCSLTSNHHVFGESHDPWSTYLAEMRPRPKQGRKSTHRLLTFPEQGLALWLGPCIDYRDFSLCWLKLHFGFLEHRRCCTD